MARQRNLTIPQSVRIARVWFSLLQVNGPRIQWNYWNFPADILTHLCNDVALSELIDWQAPYTRSWGNLKIFLKAVASCTSRGNFEVLLDQWLTMPVAPANPGDQVGGGLVNKRNTIIQENAELRKQLSHCNDNQVKRTTPVHRVLGG